MSNKCRKFRTTISNPKYSLMRSYSGCRDRKTLYKALEGSDDKLITYKRQFPIGLVLIVETFADGSIAVKNTTPVCIRVYQGLWYTVRSKTKGANRNVTLRKRTR